MNRLLTILLGVAMAAPAWALAPETTDPMVVMKAVEARAKGDQAKARMVMTITDKAGRQRQRVVKSRSMVFAGGRKQIMVFESPQDVAGTGLLSVDYDDGAKDDDQWLYLPSLHKSTRISSGEKSGSFMGTDFSYADMTKADPAHYEYKMLDPAKTCPDGECWFIEARPKTQKAKDETGYLKTRLFVSKTALIPLRIKAWVLKGKKIKYLESKDVRQVNGIWVAHTLTATTKKGGQVESSTVLQFSEMSFGNADVKADDFSQRRLEKGL